MKYAIFIAIILNYCYAQTLIKIEKDTIPLNEWLAVNPNPIFIKLPSLTVELAVHTVDYENKIFTKYFGIFFENNKYIQRNKCIYKIN